MPLDVLQLFSGEPLAMRITKDGGPDVHVSMRLDEKNTMVFRVFLYLFLVQQLLAKNLILPKKQHFLFDLPWEGKNVTSGSKIGHG